MEPTFAIVFAVLLAAAFVLMLFERRIMRKPESERSERERRYLAGSRRFAMAQNRIVSWVAPIMLVLLGIACLVLGSTLGVSVGDGIDVTFWVMGAISLIGGIAFFIFFRKRRGRDWEQRQHAENTAADEAGRVRWFGAPRYAVGVGIAFTAIGAFFLWASLSWSPGIHPLVATGMLVVGVVFTVSAISQLRREKADR